MHDRWKSTMPRVDSTGAVVSKGSNQEVFVFRFCLSYEGLEYGLRCDQFSTVGGSRVLPVCLV